MGLVLMAGGINWDNWKEAGTTIIFITLLSVGILQALAILLQSLFPSVLVFKSLKFGMFFYVIILVAVIYLALGLITRQYILDTKNLFVIFVVLAILIWLLFSIKGLVPQAFSTYNLALQSAFKI